MDELPHTTRWYNTVVNQTEVKQVLDKIDFRIGVGEGEETKEQPESAMSDPVAEVTDEVKNVSVGENAIYTSDSRGSDVGGEGTYKVPFKTVMKAMNHAGKEPFPTIYVDVKPDSEAAKSGARYEVIAKAQLKKVTKLWQQEVKKEEKRLQVEKEAEEARLKRAEEAKRIQVEKEAEEARLK